MDLRSRSSKPSFAWNQARPASCHQKQSPPCRPARPDRIAAGPDSPAHGRQPGRPAAGRKASRERRAGGGRRGDGKAGACREPEIPAARISPYKASGPPGILSLRNDRPAGASQPALTASCRPGRLGPRAAARQASGRTKASRECRASGGGAAMARQARQDAGN